MGNEVQNKTKTKSSLKSKFPIELTLNEQIEIFSELVVDSYLNSLRKNEKEKLKNYD